MNWFSMLSMVLGVPLAANALQGRMLPSAGGDFADYLWQAPPRSPSMSTAEEATTDQVAPLDPQSLANTIAGSIPDLPGALATRGDRCRRPAKSPAAVSFTRCRCARSNAYAVCRWFRSNVLAICWCAGARWFSTSWRSSGRSCTIKSFIYTNAPIRIFTNIL